MVGDVSVPQDARERLEPADLDAGDLLAATHVHRYEFAARLCQAGRVADVCCGTGYGSEILSRTAAAVRGVDLSEEAIASARGRYGDDEAGKLTFESGDALEFLRAAGAGEFDMVVCFEGLEHVQDASAVVTEMARLAESGTALALSLPNSRLFNEQNEFHVTDYGFEEMRAVAERFADPIVLSQFHAEASLIARAGPDAARELHGRVADPPDDVASANHWLILVGVDSQTVDAAEAALALTVEPQQNDYMRTLERANAQLYRANQRLARTHLGVHDAAAASVVTRATTLEARVAALERELELERRTRVQHEATLDAPRYRAVDSARAFAFRLPGVGTLLRLRSRLIQRRGDLARTTASDE
jgi:2-polyprenyl-3-methyl-5-hydroxy-6-metoxy-1,4-benzoquinol methylase